MDSIIVKNLIGQDLQESLKLAVTVWQQVKAWVMVLKNDNFISAVKRIEFSKFRPETLKK